MAFYDAVSRYTLDDSGINAVRSDLKQVTYRTYTVREGDTLESIAQAVLGTQRRFWEIADINPQVKFPLDLVPGNSIRLPL